MGIAIDSAGTVKAFRVCVYDLWVVYAHPNPSSSTGPFTKASLTGLTEARLRPLQMDVANGVACNLHIHSPLHAEESHGHHQMSDGLVT